MNAYSVFLGMPKNEGGVDNGNDHCEPRPPSKGFCGFRVWRVLGFSAAR